MSKEELETKKYEVTETVRQKLRYNKDLPEDRRSFELCLNAYRARVGGFCKAIRSCGLQSHELWTGLAGIYLE